MSITGASTPEFTRPYAAELLGRLEEPRRFLQVITGPRQVGKTTMVEQVSNRSDLPCHYASADEPQLRGPGWIGQQWDAARLLAAGAGDAGEPLAPGSPYDGDPGPAGIAGEGES